MSPVWVCLEILDDFYFMKGLISYIVTSFAFGICLSEVWALKEILEAHYFGLIRSSSSNWWNFSSESHKRKLRFFKQFIYFILKAYSFVVLSSINIHFWRRILSSTPNIVFTLVFPRSFRPPELFAVLHVHVPLGFRSAWQRAYFRRTPDLARNLSLYSLGARARANTDVTKAFL